MKFGKKLNPKQGFFKRSRMIFIKFKQRLQKRLKKMRQKIKNLRGLQSLKLPNNIKMKRITLKENGFKVSLKKKPKIALKKKMRNPLNVKSGTLLKHKPVKVNSLLSKIKLK